MRLRDFTKRHWNHSGKLWMLNHPMSQAWSPQQLFWESWATNHYQLWEAFWLMLSVSTEQTLLHGTILGWYAKLRWVHRQWKLPNVLRLQHFFKKLHQLNPSDDISMHHFLHRFMNVNYFMEMCFSTLSLILTVQNVFK